jgi:hypothetical protein
MSSDFDRQIRAAAGIPVEPAKPVEPPIGRIGVGVGAGAAEPRPTRPSVDSLLRAMVDERRERLADLAAYYERERRHRD